nr:hypothetical protein [Desulfosporosinus fructosivorans]
MRRPWRNGGSARPCALPRIWGRELTNDSLLSQINQKIKLCDEKKQKLVDHFITWLVDEKL